MQRLLMATSDRKGVNNPCHCLSIYHHVCFFSFFFLFLPQVEGNEYRITADLVCSRVLEQLIQLCNSAQLTKLFASFVPEMERMLTNRYASHVL